MTSVLCWRSLCPHLRAANGGKRAALYATTSSPPSREEGISQETGTKLVHGDSGRRWRVLWWWFTLSEVCFFGVVCVSECFRMFRVNDRAAAFCEKTFTSETRANDRPREKVN